MGHQSIDLDPFASVTAHLESSVGSKVGGGRYTLVRIIGRGGMGIVWLARDERLNCEVALKFLPPQIRYDASALDDLRRETLRCHQLTHPNIIRVHDLYELPGEDTFISMEYVEGRNLAELRVEQPSRVFSWQFLKPIADQLCAALDYAHNERIVHRDLKPANLMVDNRGRLKLADFGIARAVSDTMSRISMNQTSGTLLYMSPQQMEGGAPHPTDDIYALGAILYELLTGKPPFFTGDIAHQVRNVAPRPIGERLDELETSSDVPYGIEQVIMACLSKKAADRPQTAAEVARLLNSEKLKLVSKLDTQPHLTVSERQAASRVNKTAWKWAIASGIVCGISVWALAYVSQLNARKRQASRAQESPAILAAAVAEPGVSNNPAMAQGLPLAAPPPVTPETPAAAQKPSRNVAQVLAAALAPAASASANIMSSSAPPRSASAELQTETDLKDVSSSPASSSGVATVLGTPENETNNVASLTALQLLQKGNTHVSSRSQNRVLQMASSRSRVDDPPQSWRILYHDEKATYNAVEVRFEAGEMERLHEPNRFFDLFTPGSSKILDLAKVKIDSDEAIRIAVAECDNDDVRAKWIELKLERGYGGLPVWNAKLFGVAPGKSSDETSLGYIVLLAEDGKVLKKDIVTKSDKVIPRK